jgi:hypothetical protein
MARLAWVAGAHLARCSGPAMNRLKLRKDQNWFTANMSQQHNFSHLLPSTFKETITAWLAEDVPSFDYGGFVVGETDQVAVLYGKAKVTVHPVWPKATNYSYMVATFTIGGVDDGHVKFSD